MDDREQYVQYLQRKITLEKQTGEEAKRLLDEKSLEIYAIN
jgi:hypothetical protein